MIQTAYHHNQITGQADYLARNVGAVPMQTCQTYYLNRPRIDQTCA